jgi:hypothetical protein
MIKYKSEYWKYPLIFSGYTIASFIIVVILTVIGISPSKSFMIPFINGFLHGGLEHFFLNIVFFSLLLIPEINRYNLSQLYFITVIISFLYLPLFFLGLPLSIGLSGLLYFLAGRFFLSRLKFKKTGIAFFAIFTLLESVYIMNPDGIGHGVHLIGLSLSLITIYSPKTIKYKIFLLHE